MRKDLKNNKIMLIDSPGMIDNPSTNTLESTKYIPKNRKDHPLGSVVTISWELQNGSLKEPI